MPAIYFNRVASAFRRGTSRPAGLLAALLVGLLFAGLIGWYLWNAPKAPAPVDPRIAEFENIPDLGTAGPSGRNQFERLGSNTGPFMQFADRRDAGRVAGEITANKAEPLANQRYRLERPMAWNFLRDGRTLYVEGDSARAHFPERAGGGRPEEATIEGNVVIKLFERRTDGSRPDPQKDQALYTARTQSIRFDGALGRVHVPGTLSVSGERGSFSGAGITLLFSEVTERIELLHVDSTDFLEIIPRASGATASNSRPLALPKPLQPEVTILAASFSPAPRTVQPVAEPQVVEYQLNALDDVVITQGGTTITGQTFAAWVRLIDNKLPGRTELAPSRPRETVSSQPPPSDSTVGPADARTPPASSPFVADQTPSRISAGTTPPDRDAPVRITFKGPLDLVPVKETPVELGFNDVFVRLTSPLDGGVTAADADSGARASGRLLEYGATRQDVALGADAPGGAELLLQDKGTLRARRVDLSLTSGLARVHGAGEIAQILSDDQPPQSILWSDSAEFTFELVQGRISSILRKALLIGSVRATATSLAGFSADQCQADFLVKESSSTLSRLFLSGNARGCDGGNGLLEANSVDVRFVAGRDAGVAIPLRMLALGNVVASQNGNQIKTAELDADLATDPQGDSVLTRVRARGGVDFQNADGVRVASERMDADPVDRIVDISGVDARVSRGDSVIRAARIRVFGDRRRMEVHTPGTFTHRELSSDGRVTEATARWWHSMTFDDLAGEVECRGQTLAELVRGDVERSRLESEVVRITLAPEAGASHEPDAGSSEDDSSDSLGSRAVRKVEAIGDRERNVASKFEMKRYQPGFTQGDERVLERLVYLEGMRLIADSEKETLVVPGAGKLLAVDRRSLPPDAQSPAKEAGFGSNFDGNGARGDALFRWQGDLLMNSATGQMQMREGVRMDHRRLSDGSRVELECDDLSAQLGTPSTAGSSDQIEEVVAINRVWMRAAGRELTGGQVRYHAPSSTVTAAGEAGQNVRLMQARSGAPFSARWLSWNLSNDRFEALDAQPIIVPRR